MRLRRVLWLAVLFGVVVDVVVSVACAILPWSIYQHPREVPADRSIRVPPEWLVKKHPDGPSYLANTKIELDYLEWRRTGLSLSKVRADEIIRSDDLPLLGEHTLTRIRSGWPFKSFECVVRGGWGEPKETLSEGAGFRVRLGGWTWVPLMPIAGGLLLNSSLFAGAFVATVGGFVAIRSTTRRRRGRCPRCSYDRRGLAADAKCPECGTGR